MGICSCAHKTSDIPSSELFVPRFDVTVDKVHQKKLLRLKSLTLLNSNNNYHSSKTVSTEKFIYAKALFNHEGAQKNATFSPDIRIANRLKLIESEKRNLTSSLNSLYKDKIYKIINNHADSEENSDKKQENEIHINNNIQCEISEQTFSNSEEIFIANVLLRHYLFNRASKEQINMIISEMNEYQIDENNYLFYEGEKGSCIYIIKKGKVELSQKNNNKQVILSPGSVFGDLAIISPDSKREYNAKSLTKLEFYIIDYNTIELMTQDLKLSSNFNFLLFNFLDDSIQSKIKKFVSGIEFSQGKFITELNGILGIENGELSIIDIKENKEIEVYRKGEILGMKNLLFNPEDCSNKIQTNYQFGDNIRITAKENTKCAFIPIISFIEILGLDYSFKILYSFFNKVLVQNLLFYRLCSNKHDLKKLYPLFELKEYKKNDIIYNKRTFSQNKKIQIVIEGMARYIETFGGDINTNAKGCATTGNIIGEECVSGHLNFKNDMKVTSEKMIVLETSWNEIKDNTTINSLPLSKIIKRLHNMFLLSHLPEWKLIEISKHFEEEIFNKGNKIISIGSKVEKVYFIKSGSVKLIVNNQTIREYYKGNSFGEIFLLNEKEAKSEVVASNKTKLYSLQRNDFYNLVGIPQLNEMTKNKLCLEDIEIIPNGLYYISTLYQGSYSNIYLVHNKISIYVVKEISIINVNKSYSNDKVVSRIINEKKAAKRLNHPFLVKYVKTIKSHNWCYFVEEYIHGMTLLDYIEMCKPNFNMKILKFYAGCLFVILDILKLYGIVHRDIKPENVMIDTKGYVKLIDFSSCKRIKNKIEKTFIGTPYFISPEVLNGKGYSYSCDYWSVGILLYYLYFGEFPFGDKNKNANSIYKLILNKKLVIKETETKEDQEVEYFKELIQNLLRKDVNERYGSFKDIKNSNFFNGFDWDGLIHQKMPAPFIPQVVQLIEEKMITNLSSPFMSFIQQDSSEKKKTTIIDFKSSTNHFLRFDKDVVMSSYDEKEKITDNPVKNWFDNF